MAREKQKVPVQRVPSGGIMHQPTDIPDMNVNPTNGTIEQSENGKPSAPVSSEPSKAGFLQLVICVTGIYASL